VPGHEWSGEVAEVGGDVATLRAGDRVVGECVVNGGDDHFGFSISGADAEYFVAKASWLHRIPDELSFAQGAFVEPLSVAYHAAVAAGGIDASDEVAVIGGGPIGLLCTLVAATMGAAVTLVEPQAHRRRLGLEVGARGAIDPGAGALSEQAAEATGGRGFDVVVEAAGVPAAMASALPIAAHSARVVLVGISVGGTAPVEIGLVQSKALQVRGIIGSAGLWPRTIRFMATSGVDPTPLLTATFPLDDGTAALDAARDTSRNVKVQIEC
jgi:L-iditol 2-dehydrogenase